MDRIAFRTLCFLLATLLVLVGFGCSVKTPTAQQSQQYIPQIAPAPTVGWTATFPGKFSLPVLSSAGSFEGGPVVVNFESLSPALLEPPTTASWNAQAGSGSDADIVFRDWVPGLVPNDPGAEPFYKRSVGAITALAWVDQELQDVRMDVRVNTSGGPGGAGSVSRQGPILRWDKGSNFSWCAINFAMGTLSIVRAQHFGIYTDIEASEQTIQGFANTTAYNLQFQAIGSQLRCRAYDQGQLVADTGKVTDPAGVIQGVAGVLLEIPPPLPAQPQAVSFTPLEGSFSEMSATNLSQQPIQEQLLKFAYDDAQAGKREEAASLYEKGLAKDSTRAYRQILISTPNDVESLKELAWILATSSDPAVRDPQEAVALAEQAFEQMIVGFNSRENRNAIPPNYDKMQILQVGAALTAAYAAAELFTTPVASSFAELVATGAITESQALVASGSAAMSALTVASWSVEMALAMQAQEPSEQMQTFVQELQSLLQMVESEQSIQDGRALPGTSGSR